MHKKTNSKEIPFIPGIIVLTGNFYANYISEQGNTSSNFQLPEKPTTVVKIGDFGIAYLLCRNTADSHSYITSDGITVLFEGYLSDIVRALAPQEFRKFPAKAIATLFRKNKDDFLLSLRGSYTCLIFDKSTDTLLFFSDRRGSRPSFYTNEKTHSIFIAPELQTITQNLPPRQNLNKGAVFEFLMSGKFYDNHTLFDQIFLLPQAGVLTASSNSIQLKKYWQLDFNPASYNYAPEDELIDECDSLFRNATRRILKVTTNPLLLLSGGIDSRILLGNLLAEGKDDIALATYSAPETDGDETNTAVAIANSLNLPIQQYQLYMSDFIATSQEAVARSDGRVEVIDAPQLFQIWDLLSKQFDTVFKGDECFGWHASVESTDAALNRNFLFRLSQMSRLQDWAQPEKLDLIKKEINTTLTNLVKHSKEKNLLDTKDKIYYEQRIGNYVNPFTGILLRNFEQARPLIDEDVVDFIKTLPLNLRDNKLFLQHLLDRRYPKLSKIPMASRYSMPRAPNFAKLFSQSIDAREFVKNQLIPLDSRLTELISLERFTPTLDTILVGQPLPSLKSNWLAKVPMLWRFRQSSFENHCHPIVLMLRLLQVNIFLKHVNKN